MAKPSVSFNDIEVRDNSVFPGGVYSVVVHKIEDKVAQSGNQMYAWTFKILDDIKYMNDEGAEVSTKGRFAWTNTIYKINNEETNRNCLAILMNVLMGLGYTEADLKKSDFTLDPESWLGCNLKIEIGLGEYNGKPKNEVVRAIPNTKGRPKSSLV